MNSFKQFFALLGGVAPGREAANLPSLQDLDEPQIDHVALAILVEEAIADDQELSSAQIDVEVFDNVVQLSGFVDAPAHMNRAVFLAGEVRGVESVRNCMQLAWW